MIVIERSSSFANGVRPIALKGKDFRVGCMGEVHRYHVMRTISAISSTLDMMGYKTNTVDALKTAEEKLKDL